MSDNSRGFTDLDNFWIFFYSKAVSAFFDNHIVIKQMLLDFFDIFIDMLQTVSIGVRTDLS